MRVVCANPPNIAELEEVFHVSGKPIFFCWGDTIYNPMGVEIDSALRCHEGVHFSRQTNDVSKIAAWWRKYIDDVQFRLTEEIPAHKAELRELIRKYPRAKSGCIQLVAERLAAPLYGNLLSVSAARKTLMR